MPWLAQGDVFFCVLQVEEGGGGVELPTTRSWSAYNGKYIMFQKIIISDQVRKLGISWVL